MTKRKILISLTVLGSSLFLGACSPTTLKPSDSVTTPAPDVTLLGTITKIGNQFILVSPPLPQTTLESRTLDLSKLTGKPVRVTGQYSGTTLFVDKVE